jgi:hypothetical protein
MKVVVILSVSVVLLFACRYREASLQESKLVREDTEPAGPFTPPADGRLSPEQIMRHLDRNFPDPAEAEWVKARVEEANNSEEAAREVRERLERSERWNAAGLEFTKGEIQSALDDAKDEPTKQQYRTMLANYDRLRAEMDAQVTHDQMSAVVYNRGLLAPHACRPGGPTPCLEIRSFE